MAYVHICDPAGRLVLTYDATRNLIAIKPAGSGVVIIDLERYRPQPTPTDEPQAATPAETP